MTTALALHCASEALYAYVVAHHVEPSSYCQFPREVA